MRFTLKEKFTIDEKKIINTAFYVWQNSALDGFDRSLKRDVKQGMTSALPKIMNDKIDFTATEHMAIEYTLILLHDYFLNRDEHLNLDDLKQNGKLYVELMRSIARKIYSDYDFCAID